MQQQQPPLTVAVGRHRSPVFCATAGVRNSIKELVSPLPEAVGIACYALRPALLQAAAAAQPTWYGFSLVSSAQLSASVCLPSLPPTATRKRLATSASVCAYRAEGPAPATITLQRVAHMVDSGAAAQPAGRSIGKAVLTACRMFRCTASRFDPFPQAMFWHHPHLCQRGLSRSVKSSTCRSSEARPAGPMPPCDQDEMPSLDPLAMPCGDSLSGQTRYQQRSRCIKCPTQVLTCTTTMLPTAAAACAARGLGGSPSGVTFSHRPLRTSMMCTSLVAPASRMPAVHEEVRQGDWAAECVRLGQERKPMLQGSVRSSGSS